jgi:hypothetical protein
LEDSCDHQKESRPPEICTQNLIFQYNTPNKFIMLQGQTFDIKAQQKYCQITKKYNKKTETKMGTLYTSADVPLSF